MNTALQIFGWLIVAVIVICFLDFMADVQKRVNRRHHPEWYDKPCKWKCSAYPRCACRDQEHEMGLPLRDSPSDYRR